MIVWFCNLKFLSIRSNVKRVDYLKLAEQIGKVRAERLEQNDQSRSKRLCSLSSVWAIHFCRYSLSGVDTCNDVPTSSPGRFSLALEVGRSTSKARESAPVRCLYFDFYLWILFSLYRIKMEIPRFLRPPSLLQHWSHKLTALHYIQNQEHYKCVSPMWFRRRPPTPCKRYEWAIWVNSLLSVKGHLFNISVVRFCQQKQL